MASGVSTLTRFTALGETRSTSRRSSPHRSRRKPRTSSSFFSPEGMPPPRQAPFVCRFPFSKKAKTHEIRISKIRTSAGIPERHASSAKWIQSPGSGRGEDVLGRLPQREHTGGGLHSDRFPPLLR